jgi:hypothetical protein
VAKKRGHAPPSPKYYYLMKLLASLCLWDQGVDIVLLLSWFLLCRSILTTIKFSCADSKFTQQELPACKPILTPKWVCLLVLQATVLLLPRGHEYAFWSSSRMFWLVLRRLSRCFSLWESCSYQLALFRC